MAYIKNNTYEIGNWVYTTKIHESMDGKFPIGSRVKIIGVSNRGYNIEDNNRNRMYEIGWII